MAGRLDYAKEVEPGAREEGGLFLQEYDGDDFDGGGSCAPWTNADEAQEFFDKQAYEESDEPAERRLLRGVDFNVENDDGPVIGFIGDYLVVAAKRKPTFEAMVDASDGDERSDEAGNLHDAVATPPDQGVGRRLRRHRRPDRTGRWQIGPKTESPSKRRGSNRGSDRGRQPDPRLRTRSRSTSAPTSRRQPAVSGDASAAARSLPATSVAAFATAEFGDRFGEAIDRSRQRRDRAARSNREN